MRTTATQSGLGLRSTRGRGAAVIALAGMLALTACSGGQKVGSDTPSTTGSSGAAASPYGFETATQNESAEITVWVDSTRQPAAKAFQATHPNIKVNIVTYDGNANGSNTFKTKSQLFDRSGSGWPDVAFTTDNNSASWGSLQGTKALAPVNKGLVAQDAIDGFAKGALDVCTLDGVAYCLRNDLAQNVLWYNKKLMDQFGYKVPTTWEEYIALGEKVATEHPGYIVGTAGDAWTPEIYFWAAQCPANNVTGPKAITVNTADANCVKAAKMLDKLIANKTMSTLSLFGPEFAKTQGDKVLMLPGPSWYGGAVFQGTIKTPKGEVAAAAPLKWADATSSATGNVGGGAWWISAHSVNLKAATEFATWVTSQSEIDGTLVPTYPANTKAAAAWVTASQKDGYFANDIQPAFETAAGEVWSGWGSPAFSQEAIWAKVVQAGMTKGQTIESLLPAWQTQVVNEAKVLGYTVTTP